MDSQYITALAISAAGVALSFSVLRRYTGLGQRASAVISIAFGVITLLYLEDNPDVLGDTAREIAIAVIGGVVALALLIRKRAGK